MRPRSGRGHPARSLGVRAGCPRSRDKPSCVSTMCRSGGREIEFRNLGAGGAPHALMAADVLERSVERPDTMRHAADVGMERNWKHAAGIGALTIEHIEAAADHVAKLGRRYVHALISGFVVGLLRIGHRHEATTAVEMHDVGLVVIAPVA